MLLPSASLASSAPFPSHRQAAAGTAALLSLLAALSLFSVGKAMGPLLGLPAALSASTLVIHLVTAALLLAQGVAGEACGPLRLGAAYLFATAIILAQLAAAPGVFGSEPLIGGPGTLAWLWCAWHGGFALLVIRYALAPLSPRAPRPGVTVACVLGLAVLVTLAATACLPWLPAVTDRGSYAGMVEIGAIPAVVLANALALLLVARRLRDGNLLDLWLCVALLAATADTGLTMLGGARYSLGWYVGRVGGLLTGLLVLLALLLELVTACRRAAEANALLTDLAECDPMTGLANRRRFDRLLALEWRRAQREHQPLALLMVDVDHFKRYNDRYGHPAGDLCLKRLSVILSEAARRPGDLAVRMGGEEFALLLPNTGMAGAAAIAAGLREALTQAAIPHADGVCGQVTLSLGAAVARPTYAELDPSTLVGAADQALYRAKLAGRDQVATDEARQIA